MLKELYYGNMSQIAIADGFADGFCLGMQIATEVMEKITLAK